jgi:hypothetical protein
MDLAGAARLTTLTLAEELVLLATDERGSVAGAASASLDNGIAGARLLELALAGRVALRDDAIAVIDERPTGEPLADEALATIGASSRARSAKHWVGKLASATARRRVLERLDERGVLAPERSRVLGLVPRTRHVEADPAPERAIRARLLAAARGEDPAPDARTVALASLVRACNLVGSVFERAERKDAKRRLAELSAPDAVGPAVKAVTDATSAAIMAAVVATTAGATAASGSGS